MGDLQNNGINRLGELFNEYHREYLSATETSEQMLDVTLTVRVRLYGNDLQKQMWWDRDWRSKHPEWGRVQWCSVSSKPPEIWGDLRETEDGEIVINRLALGHEISHALKLLDGRVLDPDQDVKL